MKRYIGWFRKWLIAAPIAVAAAVLFAASYPPYPSTKEELNNIPGDMPLGDYIEYLSSNTVQNIVVLTNGVLTVGTNSINISSPTHMVVTTNIIEGVPVISTNYYPVAYFDQMSNTIARATNALETVIETIFTTNIVEGDTGWVTNITKTIITNHLVYTDDLRKQQGADFSKADKEMVIWNFYCPTINSELSFDYYPGAVTNATWTWHSLTDVNGYSDMKLWYEAGMWHCLTNGESPPMSIEGKYTDNQVQVGNLTFIPTNINTVAFVVYSDYLARNYVSKTNLNAVAYAIEDENLNTLNGVADTLRAIRREIIGIAGGNRTYLTIIGLEEGNTVYIGPVTMLPPDTYVDIDWGDGARYSTINLPTNHTYTSVGESGKMMITISGSLKVINQANASRGVQLIGRSVMMPREATSAWVHFIPEGGILQKVSFEPLVGVEEFGYRTFYESGITSLDFIPNTVTRLGEYCFSASEITSLKGLDGLNIEVIPASCFRGCNYMTKLEGMPNSVVTIGNEAFAHCYELNNLVGLSTGLKTIGDSAFAETPLLSLEYLKYTQLENLGTNAFYATGIKSLEGLPESLCYIPESAFRATALESLSGMPLSITNIGDRAFSDIDTLQDATALPEGLVNIGASAFGDNSNLTAIQVPSTVTSIGTNAFDSDRTDPLSAKMVLKTIDEVTSMTAFPWANDTNKKTLKFYCLDGLIEWNDDSSNWTNESYKIEFTLNGSTFNYTPFGFYTNNVSYLIILDDKNLQFDWGDGTVTPNPNYTYKTATSTNLTVSVFGRMKGFKGTSNRPWFHLDQSGETINQYVTSFSFGDFVGLEVIGDHAFERYTRLSSLNGLPNGVTTIGSKAFKRCESITSLDGMPETTVYLGNEAFAFCYSLTTLNGISSSLKFIDSKCFSDCYALTSIADLNGTSLTNMGSGVFSGCINLTSTDGLPEGLRCLPPSTFDGCLSLTTVENFPTSISILGDRAFAGCTNLAQVTLNGTNIQNVGAAVFSNCVHLTSLTLTAGVNIIGDSAFQDCRLLTYLEIPDTVTTIGQDAFKEVGTSAAFTTNEAKYCYQAIIKFPGRTCEDVGNLIQTWMEVPLTAQLNCDDGYLIWLNDKWTRISQAARFSLTNVQTNQVFTLQNDVFVAPIGESLKISWGDGTFGNEEPINSKYEHTYTNEGSYEVVVYGDIAMMNDLSADRGPFLSSATPTEGESPGKTHYNTNLTGFAIARSETFGGYVGAYTFYNCSNLTSVSGLSSASQSARASPRKASPKKSIFFRSERDSVTAIGQHCFDGCAGLTSLTGMPVRMSSIGSGSFANCSGLENIDGFPRSGGTLNDRMFNNCIRLESMRGLPDNIAEIGERAFDGCKSLDGFSGVSSNKNITTLEGRSFANCTNMPNLSGMPGSISKLGIASFYQSGMTNLVGLSTGVTELASSTFEGCPRLQSVAGMGNNVRSVGDSSFYNCSNLITMSDMSVSVTNFGEMAFALCTGLSTGAMPRTVQKIGDNAFNNTGVLAPNTADFSGMSFNTRISAENLDCVAVASLLNASSNINPFVEFLCSDGIVVCITNRWYPLYRNIVIEMTNVTKGTTYTIGEVVPHTNGLTNTTYPIMVFWGDGTSNSYVNGLYHTYTKSGNYSVEVRGFVKEIAAKSTRFPFLSASGAANPNIVKVSVGAISKLEKLGGHCFRGCSNLKSLNGIKFTRNGGLTDSEITTLGTMCFRDCTALTSLDGLPMSVTILGNDCFSGCTSLALLDGLPKNITSIPTNCFAGCSSLRSIWSPAPINEYQFGCFSRCVSLTSLQGMSQEIFISTNQDETSSIRIEPAVFSYCTSLTNITDYTAAYLTEDLFRGCISLSSIRGVPAVAEIPKGCFASCRNITTLEATPTSVVSIAEQAFYGCSRLANLNGLSNIESIGKESFAECRNLTSLTGLSDKLISIGERAFASDSQLTDLGIDLPQSKTALTIGDYAFVACSNLGSTANSAFFFPSNTVSFGVGAFQGCSLSELRTLPPSITSLSSNLFDSTSLFNLSIETNVSAISIFTFTNGRHSVSQISGLPTSCVLYMGGMTCDEIMGTKGFPWGATTTTRFVGYDGFIVYHNGEWVKLSVSIEVDINVTSQSQVTLKGLWAEESNHGYCVEWGDGDYSVWQTSNSSQTHTYKSTGLKTLNIFLPITRINGSGPRQNNPFISCGTGSSVTCVRISPIINLRILGRNAFYGMSSMTNLPTLANSVTNINTGCFEGCSSIPEITTLPPSIGMLGGKAFKDCIALTNCTLGLPQLLVLDDNLFNGCTNLSELKFDTLTNVHTIGTRAFANCSSLYTIPVADLPNLSTIRDYAFENCIALEYMSMPLDFIATNIGVGAFTNVGNAVSPERDDTIYNEYYFKTIICFPNSTCHEILEAPNFPWGANEFVNFQAMDGNVVWKSNEWVAVYGPLYMVVNVDGGDTVHVQGIGGKQGDFNYLSWGDGTILTNTYTTSGDKNFNHTYTATNQYFISFRGTVRSIKGNNQLNLPFIFSETPQGSTNMHNLVYVNTSEDSEVKEIGAAAFENCINLMSIEDLKSAYTNIGNSAFRHCRSLITAYIPDSVTSIEGYAFESCTNIIVARMPDNQKLTVRRNVFDKCDNLRTIQFDSYTWPTMATNAFVSTESQSKLQISARNILMKTIDPAYSSPGYTSTFYGLRNNDNIIVSCMDGDISYMTKNGVTAWWANSKAIEITLAEVRNDVNVVLEEPEWYWVESSRSAKPARSYQRRARRRGNSGTTSDWWFLEKLKEGQRKIQESFNKDPGRLVHLGRPAQGIPTLVGPAQVAPKPQDLIALAAEILSKPTLASFWPWKDRKSGDTYGIIIDWGDGRGRDQTSYAHYWGNHQYWNTNSVTITIIGRLAGLKCGKEVTSFRRNPDGDYLPFLHYGDGTPCKVTSIKVGDGVDLQNVSHHCFAWYDKMTNCVLPETVVSIGESAFKGTGIKNLSCLPGNLTAIPPRCFIGCTNLTSLAGMPSSINNIGDEAFAGRFDYGRYYGFLGTINPYTQSVNKNNGSIIYTPYVIGLKSLSTLSSLPSPINLTTMGKRVFCRSDLNSLDGITKIKFPNNIIPEETFRGTKISRFPDSMTGSPVTKFDKYCFAETSLSSLANTPNSLRVLGEGCFADCTSLRGIDDLNYNVTEIPPNCFAGCTGFPNLFVVPSRITRWYFNSFHALACVAANNGSPSETSHKPCDMYFKNMAFCAGAGMSEYVMPRLEFKFHFNNAAESVINFGRFVRYRHYYGNKYYDTPIIVDWGNGDVRISTQESDDIGTYLGRSGDWTVTVYGFVQKLIPRPNQTCFMLGANTTDYGYNDRMTVSLTGLTFTDTVGLLEMSSNCFSNCPNMSMVECKYTVSPDDISWWHTYAQSRVETYVYSHYNAYITEQIPSWVNYPWGIGSPTSQGINDEPATVVATISDSSSVTVSPASDEWTYLASSRNGTSVALRWADADSQVEVPVFPGVYGTLPFTANQLFTIKALGIRSAKRRAVKKSARRSPEKPSGSFYVEGGVYDSMLPNTITLEHYNPTDEIRDYMFYNFLSLGKIPPITNEITAVGAHAFENTKIGDFGTIPASVTNIKERAFATSQLQDYHVNVLSSNVTIGVEAFGTHYPFGASKKTVEFPNIEAGVLTNMVNFPFAKMENAALGKSAPSGYTNEFTIYRCKRSNGDGLVELSPVNVGTGDRVRWKWMER